MFNVAIKITIRTICKNCDLVVVVVLERTDFVLYYTTKISLFSLKLVVQIGTSLFKSTASLLCGTELDRGNSGQWVDAEILAGSMVEVSLCFLRVV